MISRGPYDAGSDRNFVLRAFLLVSGAGVGLAGMLTDRELLVYAGIAILALGLIVRLINRRQRESKSDDGYESDDQ